MLRKGLLWVSSGNVIRSILRIILIAIISRLIAPTDFGKFAVLLVIVNFIGIINQIGVASAIIQKKELSSAEINDSFIFTIIYSSGITLIYLIIVPFYLQFLNQEGLLVPSMSMALFFPISAINSISEAKYKRDLAFSPIVRKNLISLVFGYGLVTIILGCLDLGLWALVAGFLSQSMMLLMLYNKSLHLIINFSLRRKNIKSIIVYGIGNSLANLFNYIGEEGDKFLFSKFYSMELLGAYSRAYQLYILPSGFFGLTFDTVFFPYLSKNQENKFLLRKIYSISTRLAFSILLPASFLMMIYADKIISLFLGPQWKQAIPLFSILILGLSFRFSAKVSKSLIKAINKVYALSFIQIINAAIIVFGVLFVVQFGYNFIPYVITGATIINFTLVFLLLTNHLKIGLTNMLSLILPGLILLIIIVVLNYCLFTLSNLFWYIKLLSFCLVVVFLILKYPVFFLGLSIKDIQSSGIKNVFENYL